MKLNIPRKQNMTGAADAGAIASSFTQSTDPSGGVDRAHLEKALLENFLSIERYVNQQSVSVCMSQTTSHTVPAPFLAATGGPWTVLWDQYNLADSTGSKVRVPEAGIYLGFAAVNGTIAATTPGIPGYVELGIGGGSSFMQPASFQMRDNGVNLVSIFSTGTVSYSGVANFLCSFPFLASTAGYITTGIGSNSTEFHGTIYAFGFVRLGEIPSKVQ